MSVLSACSSAAVRLVGQKLTTLFSASDGLPMELADLANEAATDIAKSHDWQALTKLATLSGNGVSVFDLPTDFDRMPKTAALHSKNWSYGQWRSAGGQDQFLFLKDVNFTASPGNWTMIGNQIQITPALAGSDTIRFYYLTNLIARDNVNAAKATFTADTDTFLLSERLLTLSVVWRWRQQKRRDYAEDMRNFEIALSDEIVREKGAQPIVIGGQRLKGPHIAYPGQLGS